MAVARWILLVLVGLTPFGFARADDESARPNFKPEQLAFYQQQVQPLLKQHCYKCHGPDKSKGGLRLTHRQLILRGGDSGTAVELEEPNESLLLKAVNYDGFEMPPAGKLPADKIAVLTKWVKLGLPMPAAAPPQVTAKKHSPEVNDETRQFWSFQRIERPKAPAIANVEWIRTPIDAFIYGRLAEAGLRPNSRLDKAGLLRRATYDLTGLPPTAQELTAFLQDDGDDAFERVIDRLLDSPQYGERWGRHWLDLVRYAESNSYERDNRKPHVWRYRDYVIRSLNADKPYDQFLSEQLAGDELDEVTTDGLIATGYYKLGTWQDEPVDRVQELYEDLDDILTTTAQVFMGLTLNCARCHEHKLDPIPQADYYRFMAFFHGYDRNINTVTPIAPEEEIVAQREEVEAHRESVKRNNEALSAIEKLVYDDFQDVEKEEFKHEQHKVRLLRLRVPDKLSKAKFQEYVDLKKQQGQLRRFRPRALDSALVVREHGRNPRESFVLIRGNAHARGEKVEPGFPEVLGFDDPKIEPLPPKYQSSGRRRALARWLVAPENPLTARVMANRLWQYHFGRGIVRSPNNFGFQGDAPTHPELLDWLAAELMDGDWRLKRMHKLIMLSSAYQMSSRGQVGGLEKDPENNLLWRFDPRRLSAEEIRDSVLAINGSLNLKMFGPSIYPLIPAEVKHGQSVPGAGWGNSSPEERARRSVYIHIKRSLVLPLLAAFDYADTDMTCPVRFATTQPTQALGMLNSEFFNRQASVFAEYLAKKAPGDERAQVRLALQRALQREIADREVERGVALIEKLKRDHDVPNDRALQYFCLVVINLNEVIYLD